MNDFNLTTIIHTTTRTNVSLVEAAFGQAMTIVFSYVDGNLTDIQWHDVDGDALVVNPVSTLVRAQELLGATTCDLPITGTLTLTLNGVEP